MLARIHDPEAFQTPTVEDAMDKRIEEMRQLLRAMSQPSGAEALKALRKAFPDAPLSLRLAAISAR